MNIIKTNNNYHHFTTLTFPLFRCKKKETSFKFTECWLENKGVLKLSAGKDLQKVKDYKQELVDEDAGRINYHLIEIESE